MESARSQGKVEILLSCQTHDPGRGSFMVNPLPVKKQSGGQKTITHRGIKLHVFRAAHHASKRGWETHPAAFDYAVTYR